MLESLIDASQRKFPTVGRKPIERGGRGEFEVRSSRFEVLGTLNLELQIVRVAQLFWRCLLIGDTGVLGGSRKWNLAEDRIAVSGHKPIQQIAEWPN